MIVRELKPDFAVPGMPAGAAPVGVEVSPLWRDGASQRTRDLAWCSLSPPLLARLPVSADGTPAQLARWPAGTLVSWQAWLASADPGQLPETLTELSELAIPDGRSLRLGRHAERLLRFTLEHAPGIELLAANVPVRRAGNGGIQTLGELDFVWRDALSGASVHWEMAAKFYLFVDGGAGQRSLSHNFVGPNLADRLGDKLEHLVQRQLPLGLTPEARALLGHAIDRSEIYLLGWLFYRDGVLPAGLDALGIAPDHLRGWWSSLDDWFERATDASCQGARWCRLPRANWLSCARVATDQTDSAEALHAMLAQRFADTRDTHNWRRESPVMLCELEPLGDSASPLWVERSRGFVVPPGWEQRAIERAAR